MAAPPAGPRYELSFQITVDDIIYASKLHQRTLTLMTAAAGPLLIVIGGTLALLGSELWVSGLFTAYGILLLIFTQSRAVARWRVRRVAKSLIGQETLVRIDQDGVDLKRRDSTSHLEWSDLSAVMSDAHVVLLKRDRLPALWIPTAAFASPEQRAEVEQHLRDQIVSSPLQRPSR